MIAIPPSNPSAASISSSGLRLRMSTTSASATAPAPITVSTNRSRAGLTAAPRRQREPRPRPVPTCGDVAETPAATAADVTLLFRVLIDAGKRRRVRGGLAGVAAQVLPQDQE